MSKTNDQIKAEDVAVLDGTDPGFWGLEAGEHVVIVGTAMIHLNADNKVVGVEFTDEDGESHGIVEVDPATGVPSFPETPEQRLEQRLEVNRQRRESYEAGYRNGRAVALATR